MEKIIKDLKKYDGYCGDVIVNGLSLFPQVRLFVSVNIDKIKLVFRDCHNGNILLTGIYYVCDIEKYNIEVIPSLVGFNKEFLSISIVEKY